MLDLGILPKSRGVTMIEVAITLAIVALAMLVGLPSISDWIQNSRIRTAAESVKNGLQLARVEAVRRNAPVEFVLSSPGALGGTGWQIRLVRTNTIAYSKPGQEGSQTVVVAATPADATLVTFTGLGRRNTTNSDNSSVLTQVDLDVPSSVLPAEQSRELRVTIDVGGQIRMCDPNISDSGDPRIC